MKKIWVDGSTTCVCWVVEGEEPVVTPFPFGKKATVNQAEYLAVLWALEREGGRFEEIEIVSDSQLIVRQLNGEYKIREPRLQELAKAVRMTTTWKGINAKFTWLSRLANKAGLVLDSRQRGVRRTSL